MPGMSRAILAAAVVLAAAIACSISVNAHAPLGAPALAANVTRQELPDGPGKELLPKLCAGCHDLNFTISTRETEEGWTRVVNDMRSKGADGSEADFAKVIAYLTKNMGKP